MRERHLLTLEAFESLGLLEEGAAHAQQKRYPWTEGCLFRCAACPAVHNSLRRMQMHTKLEHSSGDFLRSQVSECFRRGCLPGN